jgi:hypothetical protein
LEILWIDMVLCSIWQNIRLFSVSKKDIKRPGYPAGYPVRP